MSPKTLFVLFAAVLALGFAAWWTHTRQTRDALAGEVALFEGVESARIQALVIENVVRGQHLRIERSPARSWVITDPAQANADTALVELVLKSALERRGTPVPETEADPAKLGLAPPASILSIEELVDGKTHVQRAEFGAVDPDGERVAVRVRGQLIRVWRDLATTLARHTDDFRSHQLLSLDAREIIEIHRTGKLTLPDGREIDANFDAFADGGLWRATAPVRGQLDPLGMSIWTSALSRLGIASYADFGTAPLANFGLEPPEVTLSIGTAATTLPLLRFGRANHDRNGDWMCSVVGDPHVYAIDPGAIGLLTAGVDDLLDHRLLRLARNAIDGFRLHNVRGALEVALQRKIWRVRALPRGSSEWSAWQDAERARVEDVLGELDRMEFARFDRGAVLEPAAALSGIHVRAGSVEQGGVLGQPFEGEQGARAVHFLRDGDGVVAIADARLAEIANTEIEQLLSLRVVELVEVTLRALTIGDKVRAERTRSYVHNAQGVWVSPSLGTEARELKPLLDQLLFPRAERHLTPAERVELTGNIFVVFARDDGVKVEYSLGRVASGPLAGRVVYLNDALRQSLAPDATLYEQLDALLGH
jgi:hypothetical protein